MQQYRVEFFRNAIDDQNRHYLEHVYHDITDAILLDDDYLAIQSTVFEIRPTTEVETGDLVRLLRDEDTYFFGIVSNVAPGEYTTSVTIQPFISIFDAPILFDSADQSKNTEEYSLENILKKYIEANYVRNSDNLQNFPLIVEVPETGNHTNKWDMNIGVDFLREDSEDAQKVVINFYETLIVNALKIYSVAINPTVDFSTGQITLHIGKIEEERFVDADLDNATVVTLKVNERPNGTNKLVVYNAEDFSMTPFIFYVHPDRTWDATNENRILPVAVEITTVSPDTNAEDQAQAFALAAIESAYQTLSGMEWDDLIELQCASNDAVINPMTLKIGQMVRIFYRDGIYRSILTGRTVAPDYVKLIFGSERIQFTKLRASNRKRR